MRLIVLAISFALFTAITGQFATAREKQGTEGPDTVVGRWVADALELGGKKLTRADEGFHKGMLYKFNADGTGLIGVKKIKWSYNKETRAITVTEEGVLWGWNAPYDYDVTKDGESIIFARMALMDNRLGSH